MTTTAKPSTSVRQVLKKLPSLTPIVEEDGLFLDNRRPARLHVPTDFENSGRRVQGFRVPRFADELSFAKCFVFVWFRLPEKVRRCLLAHWRIRTLEQPLSLRPHIRVVDDDLLGNARAVCYGHGFKLTFQASLTTAFRDMLPFVIAHELGHVFRMATGAFDLLFQREVGEPLDEWEREYENENRGERRAEKLRYLQRRWRVLEEEETDKLTAQWGFQWSEQPRAILSEEENDELGERLRAYDRLHEAPLQPSGMRPDDDGVIELPDLLTRLDRLPEGHPARDGLAERGFDADRLGRCYKLHYCKESDDPLAHERLIIPVHLDGRLRGWQSMPVEGTTKQQGKSSFQYLPALGMNRSRLIYNLDKARKYQTVVIVKEPADVWAFGPMAVSMLGDTVSDFQRRLLVDALRQSSVVVLLAKEDRRRSDIIELVAALRRNLPGRLATVDVPHGLPRGSKGRTKLRAHVVEVAETQGVRVSFAKNQ